MKDIIVAVAMYVAALWIDWQATVVLTGLLVAGGVVWAAIVYVMMLVEGRRHERR